MGKNSSCTSLDELFSQSVAAIPFPVADQSKGGVVGDSVIIQCPLVTTGTVGSMTALHRACDHANSGVTVIQQQLRCVVCRFLITVNNGRNGFVFADTICTDKFWLRMFGERNDNMAVATDVDNAIYLFGEHIIDSSMDQGCAFPHIFRAIAVALIKAKIAQNIVIPCVITGLRNAIDNFRRIKNGQIFSDNPDGFALTGF